MPNTWITIVPVFSLFLLAVSSAHAQPLSPQTESLESLVANADSIYVARLEKFGERQRREDGHEAHNTTIAIEQTLKRVMFRDYSPPMRQMWMPHHESILQDWKQNSSRLLVVTNEYEPFETVVIELAEGNMEVMRADFTLYRDPEPVIEAIQAIVSELSPAVKRINTFQVDVPRELVKDTTWDKFYDTGGNLRLSVPVDRHLEKWALESTRADRYMTRSASARALRYFRSDENIQRLKQLLNDPMSYTREFPEGNKTITETFYGVRYEAYETLKSWGVEVEEPVFSVRTEVMESGK